MAEVKTKEPETSNPAASQENANKPKDVKVEQCAALTDEEFWEEQLFISRGPAGWNIGCGCG